MLYSLGHSITQLFKLGNEKSIHVVGVRINPFAKLHGRVKSAKFAKIFENMQQFFFFAKIKTKSSNTDQGELK